MNMKRVLDNISFDLDLWSNYVFLVNAFPPEHLDLATSKFADVWVT